MKAKPFKIVDGMEVECPASEAEILHLHVPCPVIELNHRRIPVIQHGSRKDTPAWTWNGCIDKPTLRPSVLTTWETPNEKVVCHSFITDGKVQFLADSTHINAGKTLDLMDVNE